MEESDLVDTKDTPPIIASIDAQGKYYVSVGTNPEEPMEALDVAAVIKLQLMKNPETPITNIVSALNFLKFMQWICPHMQEYR